MQSSKKMKTYCYQNQQIAGKVMQYQKLTSGETIIEFHMACAYSILERTEEGFNCLQKAVTYGLPDTEMILNHDMIAFLRMDPAFEGFLNSGFTKYDMLNSGKDE